MLAPEVGLVKIGCSDDPIGRMLKLRTMNAAKVEPLVVLSVPEARMHERFHHLRSHGEWFRINHEIVDYLELLDEFEAADRMRLMLGTCG